MMHLFDVFQVDKTGIPLWVETAETLETAKGRVGEMLQLNPTGEYMILNQRTQNKIYVKANTYLEPFN